jgi:hypothetical protein
VLGILLALLAGYGIEDHENAVDAAPHAARHAPGFAELDELGCTKAAKTSMSAINASSTRSMWR